MGNIGQIGAVGITDGERPQATYRTRSAQEIITVQNHEVVTVHWWGNNGTAQ